MALPPQPQPVPARRAAPASAMLRRFATLPDPAVDRALAAALPSADPQTLGQTAHLLLERGRPEGLLGLVEHYDRMPGDVADRLIERVDDLYRPLREAAALGGRPALNAMAIIRAAAATPLIYLVGEQLIHGGPEQRGAAAEVLLHLARLAAPDPEGQAPPLLDADAALAVARGVDEAVDRYAAHQQRDVLLALATLLPRPMPRSMAAIARVGHAALEPMRRLCEKAEHPAIRRSLPVLAAVGTLTDAAAVGLRVCGMAGDLAEVLQGAHLWRLPAARRALLRVRLGEQVVPEEPLDLPVEGQEQRALPGLIAELAMEGPPRLARLAALAEADDRGTRIRALRRLLDLPAEPDGQAALLEAVTQFTHDADAGIVRLALWRLIHADYPALPRVLARLLASPDEGLRRVAGQRLGPVGFARFWEQWPRLTEPQRLAAGRALIKIDDQFHRRLADKLQGGSRLPRLRALSIIHVLNQGAFFEPALLALAGDRDETVASAAVKALGSVESRLARSALARALHHPDSRIRANAVEALARQDLAGHLEDLHRLAAGPDHRPRANAIAALMQVEPARAMEAMSTMLHDDRPRHRTSALWLVETLGMVELARHVAEMAISDPDGAVQQRADQVVRDLMTLMNTTPVLDAVSA